ncbi:glutaredoxin family protein [Microbacterium sp. LWO13-1.2]|uniref:glutaredoxin family protein n=1 Tax=Microbacterium sp. LWO13-1.2 TaxID=3135262 RepID=UPI003138A0B5
MTTVTVYSTGPACIRCTLTCRRLAAVGIGHTVLDITRDNHAAIREFLTEELGYTEAPVVIVDDEPEHHWSGFRPDLIDALAVHVRRTAVEQVQVSSTSLTRKVSHVRR